MAVDFFVSYALVDEPWATWIAVELESLGYSVITQIFDSHPGIDFIHMMHDALSQAARTVAVLTPAYLESQYGGVEWRAAFASDPDGERGTLVPVRVRPCAPPGLLRNRVYVDLVGADEPEARRRLRDAVAPAPRRGERTPYPGGTSVPFPGKYQQISNLPARRRNFVGRDDELIRLRAHLQEAVSASVLPMVVVHGLGGVGKSDLAVEYAYRHAADYDTVWLIPAEQPTVATAAMARLARRLGVAGADDRSVTVEALIEHLHGRDRWLLIYDNAEHPAELDDLLPRTGSGNIIVTSRWSGWRGRAESLSLGVLQREDAVRFLAKRTGRSPSTDLGDLADLLGDLPLALEEAAAYIEETGIDLKSYVRLVRGRSKELFAIASGRGGLLPGWVGPGPPRYADDTRRVATVWTVTLEKVRAQAPVVEQFLALCALLAPVVPRNLIADNADVLPVELAGTVQDPVEYNALLGLLHRYSMVDVGAATFAVHRLVQVVIRGHLSVEEERNWADVSIKLLRSALTSRGSDLELWSELEKVLPQVLTAAAHAEHLGVALESTGWLLGQFSLQMCDQGQYKLALPLATRGVEITERGLGPEHIEVAWRYAELGLVQWNLGALPAAIESHRRALALAESTLGPEHADIGVFCNNLGLALRASGALDEALRCHERSLAIGRSALGDDHADVGVRRNNLALVLHDAGRLDEAKAEFEAALRITEQALGSGHRDVAIRRNNLARVLRARGDLEGARDQYERAIEIVENCLEPGHPEIGAMRNNYGRLLCDLSDYQAARAQLVMALSITEQALGPDHPDMGLRHANLALVAKELGETAEARDHLQQALWVSETALGPEHRQSLDIRTALERLDEG